MIVKIEEMTYSMPLPQVIALHDLLVEQNKEMLTQLDQLRQVIAAARRAEAEETRKENEPPAPPAPPRHEEAASPPPPVAKQK